MDVEKIVAFKNGEPVFLDAWKPPDVPVVVLSFEPIVPRKVPSSGRSDYPYSYSLESWGSGDTIRIPFFVGFKVNAINGRYPESWWAWPMEIYIKVYLHRPRSLVIIPYWWTNDPFTGSSWISVYRPHNWYYIIYSDGGLGVPSGRPWSIVYRVEMWEEDSHVYPKPEWGGDDFWGSRSYFSIPSLWDRTSNPNDPRIWGITLWKDGHASGFFKMYYYFYILRR